MFKPQTKWAVSVADQVPRRHFRRMRARYRSQGGDCRVIAERLDQLDAHSPGYKRWLQEAIVQCIALCHSGETVRLNAPSSWIGIDQSLIISNSLKQVHHAGALCDFLEHCGIDVATWLADECRFCRKLSKLPPQEVERVAPEFAPLLREVNVQTKWLRRHGANLLDVDDAKRRQIYKGFLRDRPRHDCHPLRKEQFRERLGLTEREARTIKRLTDEEVAKMLGMSPSSYQSLDYEYATPTDLSTFASVTGYLDRAFHDRCFVPISDTLEYMAAAINGYVGGDTRIHASIEEDVKKAIAEVKKRNQAR